MDKNKEVRVLGLFTLRTLVTLIGIWILKLIIVSLPFVKELTIPNFPLTVIQIVNLLIDIVVVTMILNFGLGLSKYWPLEFPKAPEAGIVFTMLTYLIGLIVAYGAIKDLLDSLVDESEPVLILQIVFLVTAVLLLTRAALVVYQSLPKWLANLRDSLSTPPDFKE